MNLKTALELGKECGLIEVGEAVYNIKLRVGQLFEVEDYKSLINDCHEKGAKSEDKLVDWLNRLWENKVWWVRLNMNSIQNNLI